MKVCGEMIIAGFYSNDVVTFTIVKRGGAIERLQQQSSFSRRHRDNILTALNYVHPCWEWCKLGLENCQRSCRRNTKGLNCCAVAGRCKFLVSRNNSTDGYFPQVGNTTLMHFEDIPPFNFMKRGSLWSEEWVDWKVYNCCFPPATVLLPRQDDIVIVGWEEFIESSARISAPSLHRHNQMLLSIRGVATPSTSLVISWDGALVIIDQWSWGDIGEVRPGHSGSV